MQPIKDGVEALQEDRDQWPGVAVAQPAILPVDEDYRGNDISGNDIR